MAKKKITQTKKYKLHRRQGKSPSAAKAAVSKDRRRKHRKKS